VEKLKGMGEIDETEYEQMLGGMGDFILEDEK